MLKTNMLFLLCLSSLFSFNIYAINTGDGNLELLDFSVVQNMNKIDIRWSTSVIKTGGPYFCIEKSRDGKNFTKVVDIPAVDNESTFSDYFETDYQPYPGVSYYRVKQVDAEGNYRYSQVVTLKIPEEQTTENYVGISASNPGSMILDSGLKYDTTLVVLRDANGNDVYSKAVMGPENETPKTLNLSSEITPGTYHVVGSSNDKLQAKKLILK